MKWYCRYLVVIVPKYRRKSMFVVIRRDIGEISKELCRRFEVELVEGHVISGRLAPCPEGLSYKSDSCSSRFAQGIAIHDINIQSVISYLHPMLVASSGNSLRRLLISNLRSVENRS